MGIEDINISETLETNAPSIKYTGNEGPKSPQEEKMMMLIQKLMSQGMGQEEAMQVAQQMMAQAEQQQQGIESLGAMDQDPRQMAAYGGIMGMDGRKKYGIGSWFQENIMDNYKKYTGQTQKQIDEDSQKRVDSETKNYENPIDTFLKGKRGEDKAGNETRTGGQAKNIIPAIGGVLAGLFTKGTENDTPGLPSDSTAMQIDDLKKSANILNQEQGMAAGLNFLPSVASRKFTPAEMIETYQNAANGGRMGYNMGGGIMDNRMGYNDGGSVITLMDGTTVQIPNGAYDNGTFKDIIYSSSKGDLLREEIVRKLSFANGGRIGRAEGGLMDLGGMEKDYRAEGGFVPIGAKEKADDVPARLSVNEFVFTADAVRSAGGGDIDQGAQVMENMMKHLEQGGQVSEESQGMSGAQEMFETSERLSEVV